MNFLRTIVGIVSISVAPLSLAQSVGEPVSGERRPRFELNFAVGALTIPYYIGSSESESLVLPLVVPIYRGERIQFDRRGLRGSLFRGDRWALELSADASIPIDSDDIELRQGMPDLEPALQIGPSLKYTLWREASARQILRLNLPLRAVFEIDSGVNSIGYTISPNITYGSDIGTGGASPWRFGLYAGLQYGSEDYHDYYYQVDEQFELPNRRRYDAQAGYGGVRLATSVRYRTNKGSIALFARYDYLDEAEFLDSPLVDSDDGLTAGLFFVYRFYQSKETVLTQ